jgi:hypothetical protein
VTSEDVELLRLLGHGNDWLRSALCTLARRGTELRRREPERAVELLTALRPWPWFKGGQFLFDLMEWEDFMVDGPPPAVLPSLLDAAAWQRLAGRLRELQAFVDSAMEGLADDVMNAAEQLHVTVTAATEDLPPLEPGLHVYQDVILGLVASAAPALRARRQLRER